MLKRPDNISLFALMCLGVYSGSAVSGRSVFLVLFVIIPLLFAVFKQFRIFSALFLAGLMLFYVRNGEFLSRDGSFAVLDGSVISFSGRIVSASEYGSGTGVVISTGRIVTESGIHDAKLDISAFINIADLEKGDSLSVKGRFKRAEMPSNLFEKDRRAYFLSNRINGELESVKVSEIKRFDSISRKIRSAQNSIISIFDRRLSFRAANFLSAIMIGRRDRLESTVVKDFADSGAIHLLAVSGLHVGFLVAVMSFLCSLINMKGWLFIFVNSAALFGYAVFTGSSPSVLRAVLMAVIMMLSYPMNRKLRFIDIIGTAGIISLLYEPNRLFGAGFILSFGAAASIAVVYKPVSGLFYKTFPVENYVLKKIADGLLLSFSITLGLFPFLLYMYGKFNLLSIASNVVLIPLTGAAFFFGMLLVPADKINIPAEFVSDMIEVCYFIISKTVHITNSIEVLVIRYKFDLMLAVIFAVFIVSVFYIRKYHLKTYSVAAVSVLLLFRIITVSGGPVVYGFRTAENDTFLIEDCGTIVLVAGKLSRGEMNNIIKPYLAGRNIGSIDLLISFEDWNIVERTVSEIGIPVKSIAGREGLEILRGDFNFIDLELAGNFIKYNSGSIRITGRERIEMSMRGHSVSLYPGEERIHGEFKKMSSSGSSFLIDI